MSRYSPLPSKRTVDVCIHSRLHCFAVDGYFGCHQQTDDDDDEDDGGKGQSHFER